MLPDLTLSTMKLRYNKDIAVLSFTRESSLNALNTDFFADLQKVLEQLNSVNEIRALIITGQGNGFCVGADLKDLPIGTDLDLGKSLRDNFIPMVEGITDLPMPTIAAVNGYAAGAGMGLMLSCDFAIAAKSANFVQAFINIGLVPDAGSTFFLPRFIGRARANKMMMLGENITAKDAVSIGLIYKSVDDGNLMEEAMKLAVKLAKKPTFALLQIRKLLNASHENTFNDQLEAEAEAQQIAGQSKNFKEGVAAFKEKREAEFE